MATSGAEQELQWAVEQYKHNIYRLADEVGARGEQHCITVVEPHFAVMSAHVAKLKNLGEGSEVEIVPYVRNPDNPTESFTVKVRHFGLSGFAILHSPNKRLCKRLQSLITNTPSDGLRYHMLFFDEDKSDGGGAVLKCKLGMISGNRNRLDSHHCVSGSAGGSAIDIGGPCFNAALPFHFLGMIASNAKLRYDGNATLLGKIELLPKLFAGLGYIVVSLAILTGINMVKSEDLKLKGLDKDYNPMDDLFLSDSDDEGKQ